MTNRPSTDPSQYFERIVDRSIVKKIFSVKTLPGKDLLWQHVGSY